jgi:AraC family transcriptional regulator of arabinose operon
MDRRIELIIARIKTDPATAWDFAALAVLVNLSPSRFRHLFKQETGATPAQYLKEVRLRRAAKLLRNVFCRSSRYSNRLG